MDIKEEWKQQLEEQGFKYFVFKFEDFFDSLSKEEIEIFDSFIKKYNEYREPKPINKYWVLNQDEYYFKNINELLESIEYAKRAHI